MRLHDITDVVGYVKSTVAGSGIPFRSHERDELEAEGVALLYELAERFEPQREGYSQEGSFAGYASRYLPRRLMTAWHRMNENHMRVTKDDGKRVWESAPAAASLDVPMTAGAGVTRGTAKLGGVWVDGDTTAHDSDKALATSDEDSRILGAYAGAAVVVATIANPVLAEIGRQLGAQLRTEHQFTLKVALLTAMGKNRTEVQTALNAEDVEVRMALLRLRRIGAGLEDA